MIFTKYSQSSAYTNSKSSRVFFTKALRIFLLQFLPSQSKIASHKPRTGCNLKTFSQSKILWNYLFLFDEPSLDTFNIYLGTLIIKQVFKSIIVGDWIHGSFLENVLKKLGKYVCHWNRMFLPWGSNGYGVLSLGMQNPLTFADNVVWLKRIHFI